VNNKYFIKKTCPVCGVEFEHRRIYPKIYCSMSCYNKTKNGPGNPNYGKRWTAERRKELAPKLALNLKDKIYTNTKPQLALEKILKDCGFQVVKEAIFAPYFIDCYVPEVHIGWEADCKLWHSKKKDAKRDKYLFEKYHLPIKRFSDTVLLNKSMLDEIKSEIIDFMTLHATYTSKNNTVLCATGRPMIRKIMEERICKKCGKIFVTNQRSKQIYCSKVCAGIAKLPIKERRIKLPMEERTCFSCGKSFLARMTSSKKFCNRFCAQKIPWNKNKTKDEFPQLGGTKGHVSWNIGLTKETDDRLAKIGKSISISLTGWHKGMKYEEFLTPQGLKKQKDRTSKQSCSKCGRFMSKREDGRYYCKKCQ